MRKGIKTIPSIICLILCLSLVCLGVYAANSAALSLTATVSFTPTSAKLKIFAGVFGSTEYNLNEGNDRICYYANNNEIDPDANVKSQDENDITFKNWSFGLVSFNEGRMNEEILQPDPIYFFVQITNYVERNVSYKITVNNLLKDSNLTASYGYYVVDNDSQELTSTPNANGFWNINSTVASKVPFSNPALKTNANTLFVNTDSSLVSDVMECSQFTTIMMVIKLGVVDANNGVNRYDFNFTITAI